MAKAKRKWGSPAQKAAFRRMIASRGGSSSPAPRRRRVSRTVTVRRVAGTARSSRGVAGFAIVPTAKAIAMVTAGAIIPRLITNQLASKLPASLATGTGRVLVDLGVAVGVGVLARKMVGTAGAAAFVGGAGAAALTPMVASKLGLSGLGAWGDPAGIPMINAPRGLSLVNAA